MEIIMDNLLKEAIADAKAVRETALANAKLALEEAFTPRLKSMLAKKIQDDLQSETDEVEEVEERMDDEDKEDDMEERMKMSRHGDEHDDDEDMEERMKDEDDDDMEERMKMSRDGDEMDDEDETDEVIEINGVKYAPVTEEEEEDDEKDMDEVDVDENEDLDELDLESVLAELEDEVSEAEEVDEAEKVDETEEVDEAEEVDESEEIDENDVSSGIGKGDNAHDKKSGDSSGIGADGKAKMKESVEEVDEAEEVDEDIDLEEVLAALSEEEEVEESNDAVEELQSELKEHREVVKYLREKLTEVNLLNAKLLFTNKLFRAFGMNNEQKMKVVETFDRAKTLREIKLIYSTLAESMQNNNVNPIKESKGSASKATASTKSEKQEEIISEGTDMRDRFKKLANIL